MRREPSTKRPTSTTALLIQPQNMAPLGIPKSRRKLDESKLSKPSQFRCTILTTVSRVDRSVLLLLFLGLLVFQIDRMNLASALTDGFANDININQNTVNLGNQLLFMAIVIFEIPCNMALQKVCLLPSLFQNRRR